MAGTRERIEALFAQIDRMPRGAEQRTLAAEAVGWAIDAGDEELEYAARLRQTAAENGGGFVDVMLTSFDWCLARHDSDPQRFPASGRGSDLMRQFAWVAAALRGSSRFESAQIAAVLDGMESHYREAGLGMSGVLQARFADAVAAGRIEDAEQLLVALEETPRDSYSDCHACSLSRVVGFHAEAGRDAEAIRLMEEILENGYSCGEEPKSALAQALVSYVREGRFDEARTAHLRSYRLAKDNAELVDAIARNIAFCAVTGNEARALALVERHLGLLTSDPMDARGHFQLLTAIATTMERVTAVGHGDQPVHGTDSPDFAPFFGEQSDMLTAAELAPLAWGAAEWIATQFDTRDGAAGYARMLAEARRRATEHFDVPLSGDIFVPHAESRPADADGRYRRILDLVDAGAMAEAIAQVPGVIDDVDPLRRARVTSIHLGALVALGETSQAADLLARRIQSLRDADRATQADVEERFGMALFSTASAEDLAAIAELYASSPELPADTRCDLALTLALQTRAADPEQALAYAREAAAFTDVEERMRWRATRTLVGALLATGQDDEALATVDGVLAAEHTPAGARAWAHGIRARACAGRGDFAAGSADADAQCRILTEIGGRSALSGAYALAGLLHEQAGELAKGLARHRMAARLAGQAGGDEAAATFGAGRTLLALGHVGEAAETLSDAENLQGAADVSAVERAVTTHLLARALYESGEFGPAYDAFGRSAALFAEGGSPVDQAMALADQAQLLRMFQDDPAAVALLEHAVELVRPEPQAIGANTRAMHELGRAYASLKDERCFGLFDDVERLARENQAGWLVAEVLESRARGLADVGRIDPAVASALEASSKFAALGNARAAAASALLAGQVLSAAERGVDAMPAYREAIDHATDAPDIRQIAVVELGDILQAYGRDAEASEVRSLLEV